MRKTLLIFCLLIYGTVFPQQIKMHDLFGGARFELDIVSPQGQSTIVISMRQVQEIMIVDPLASAEFRTARNYNGMVGALGFAGGFLLAFPVGTLLAGGNPEWGIAGAGAGLVLASIPFTRAFKKRASSAVAMYNSKQPASRLRTRFYITGSGGALVLKF